MNYPQERTEFYELMRQKTVEILSLDIPSGEREKSLAMIKETIMSEGMSGEIENREGLLRELDKGLRNFLGICGKIDSAISKLGETMASVKRFTSDYRMSQNRERN
jgi:hypothetical protein